MYRHRAAKKPKSQGLERAPLNAASAPSFCPMCPSLPLCGRAQPVLSPSGAQDGLWRTQTGAMTRRAVASYTMGRSPAAKQRFCERKIIVAKQPWRNVQIGLTHIRQKQPPLAAGRPPSEADFGKLQVEGSLIFVQNEEKLPSEAQSGIRAPSEADFGSGTPAFGGRFWQMGAQ